MGIYTIVRGSDYDKDNQELAEKREQEIETIMDSIKENVVFTNIVPNNEIYHMILEDVKEEVKCEVETNYNIVGIDTIEVDYDNQGYTMSITYEKEY